MNPGWDAALCLYDEPGAPASPNCWHEADLGIPTPRWSRHRKEPWKPYPALSMDGRLTRLPRGPRLNCRNDTVCTGYLFMKRTLLQFRVESWIGKICTETVTDRLPMEKGRTNSKGRVPQHRQWPSRRRQRRRWRRADDGWGTWLGERRRRELSKSTDTWGGWMPINMLIDGAEA